MRYGFSNPTTGIDSSYPWYDISISSSGKGYVVLPFLQRHHRRTFVFQDGFVRVDADHERGTQLASLQHCAGMA